MWLITCDGTKVINKFNTVYSSACSRFFKVGTSFFFSNIIIALTVTESPFQGYSSRKSTVGPLLSKNIHHSEWALRTNRLCMLMRLCSSCNTMQRLHIKYGGIRADKVLAVFWERLKTESVRAEELPCIQSGVSQ